MHMLHEIITIGVYHDDTQVAKYSYLQQHIQGGVSAAVYSR